MNAPVRSQGPAPLTVFCQVSRVYEIYDRSTGAVLGRVQCARRQDLETQHPWVIEHIKEATEASGSRTGVRYIGETISKTRIAPVSNYKRYADKRSM